MGRKALAYGGGLIALYLIVVHSSNFGQDITAAANGASTLTKSLQGRN